MKPSGFEERINRAGISGWIRWAGFGARPLLRVEELGGSGQQKRAAWAYVGNGRISSLAVTGHQILYHRGHGVTQGRSFSWSRGGGVLVVRKLRLVRPEKLGRRLRLFGLRIECGELWRRPGLSLALIPRFLVGSEWAGRLVVGG